MGIIRASNPYERTVGGSYRLTGENPSVGKISGTLLAGVLGMSRWDTPFTIATKLLRIYDEDLSDVPAMKTGKKLETIMLNYLDKSGRLPNTQAEVLFPEYEEGAHLDWKSHFDDEFFSGHLDAVAGHVTDAREGFGIVENKTTTHAESWDFVNNVPPTNYWLQASVYAHFFGYSDIYFTVGILTPEEQENPSLFVPGEDNVRIMKVPIYPGFESILDRAREWYIAYIRSGITPAPDMGNPLDARIVRALDAQIATAEEILPVFQEYVAMNNEYNRLGKIVEELRTQVTIYLDSNKLDGIGNNDLFYKYSESARKSIDAEKLKEDGLYEKYLKTTTFKSLRKAKFRE